MADHTSQVGTQLSSVRERIGETAEELGHRANVPERAREAFRGRAQGLSESMRSSGGAGGGSPATPLAIALGAAAAGFLVGTLAPSTEIERDTMGGMSDDVRSAAAETAHEAVERGKDVLGEAVEVTRTRAAEEGREISEHARENMGSAVQGGGAS